MIVYWGLCYGVTIHVCLCAYMVLLFVRKADKIRFIVNRSVYSRCIMVFITVFKHLNVACMLLRADYISF